MSDDRLDVTELENEQESIGPAVSDWMSMYLNRIGKCPLLTPDEELRLAERARQGDLAAKQRLVECNLKLVVSIAKTYASSGIPLPDLIQEGNIGLMKAADAFDYRRGFRFSTYAVAWIRQAIARAIERYGRTIRIPSYVIQSLRKLNRLGSAILAQTGHEPTADELAACLHLTCQQVFKLLGTGGALASLDEQVGEDSCTRLAERLEDQAAADPEVQALHQESERLMMILMDSLNAKEKLIIQRRFGLVDGVTATLQEIGQQLHITRERVRQLEVRALKKLRLAVVRNRLEEYFHT